MQFFWYVARLGQEYLALGELYSDLVLSCLNFYKELVLLM